MIITDAELGFAVLTVSDTRSEAEDKSGKVLADRIIAANYSLVVKKIVKDDKYLIRSVVSQWIASDSVHVIICTGGTGLTGRDVTPEALRVLFDKPVEGFGEIFRWLSYKAIASSTIQSRATAGVANGTYIFCVPGSPGACKTAWDEILVHQFDSNFKPCNMREILSRLKE